MHAGDIHAGDMGGARRSADTGGQHMGANTGGRQRGPTHRANTWPTHGRHMADTWPTIGGEADHGSASTPCPPGVAALPPHCASNLPAHKTVNPVGRTRRGRARVRAMAAQQTTSSGARTPATTLERAFERKVRLGKRALLFEQLWPR